ELHRRTAAYPSDRSGRSQNRAFNMAAMAATRARKPTGRTARKSAPRKTSTPGATERRDAILAVAVDAFAASGFDGVRLHEIARAARMNQATLVYYFPSK